MQHDLVVSTSTSGLVRTSSLCARYPLEVEGRIFKVILGMDSLSANHVLIDCREKRLFSNSEEFELLSSQGVMKEIQDDAQCFIIFTTSRGGERGKDVSYTNGARI